MTKKIEYVHTFSMKFQVFSEEKEMYKIPLERIKQEAEDRVRMAPKFEYEGRETIES